MNDWGIATGKSFARVPALGGDRALKAALLEAGSRAIAY